MPAKKTNLEIQCEYFKWILFKRKEVYFADGRSNALNLGRHSLGNRDLEAARKAVVLLDLKMAVSRGMADPDRLKADISEGLPLEVGYQQYLEYSQRPRFLGGTRELTRVRYNSHWRIFKQYAAQNGITNWRQVNKVNLAAFATWRGQGAGPQTVYSAVTFIQQVMKFLISQGKIPESCRFKFEYRKPRNKPVHCYTLQEYKAILGKCRSSPQLARYAEVVQLLAYTGMRIGELVALKWSDIDFEGEVIHIEDEEYVAPGEGESRTTKSGKSREIPINPVARKVLLGMNGPRTGFVVKTWKGGPIKPNTLRREFKDLVIKPLAEKFPAKPGKPSFADACFHTFRHYFCSGCAQDGVPEIVVQGWLGHSSSEITRLYYHQNRDVSVGWMSRVNLAGSGEGKKPSCARKDSVDGRTLKGKKKPVTKRNRAG